MNVATPGRTLSTGRMISGPDSDAVAGRVVWAPAKSLWTGGLTLIALVFAPLTFSWDALVLFVVTTAATICAGHSVGMHRLLIHRSFRTSIHIEHVLKLPENTSHRDGLRRLAEAGDYVPRSLCGRNCRGCPMAAGLAT